VYEANEFVLDRFEKKVNLRKFDKYVTEVQVHAHELQDRKKVVDEV
jgi:MFS transporter, SP family, general alpha glucoside:H+ symporter